MVLFDFLLFPGRRYQYVFIPGKQLLIVLDDKIRNKYPAVIYKLLARYATPKKRVLLARLKTFDVYVPKHGFLTCAGKPSQQMFGSQMPTAASAVNTGVSRRTAVCQVVKILVTGGHML